MFVTLLVVCATGFAATVVLNVLTRLSQGATWPELVAGRFHEVVPARGLIWVAYGLAWVANVLTIATFVLMGFALFGDKRTPGLVAAVVLAGLLAGPCYLLRKWLAAKVVYGEKPAPPAVDMPAVSVAAGIKPDEFLRLGSERFPNHIDPDHAADMKIRWGLAIGGIGLALLLLFLATQKSEGPKPSPLIDPPVALAAIGLLLAYPAAALLLMLLADNRDYTFVPFRPALLIAGGLGFAACLGVLLLGATGPQLLVAVAAAAGAIGARAVVDLRVARAYARMKRTLDPIAEDIREQVPILSRLPTEPGFRQPPLRPDAVAARLARGCQNVEEKGPLVIRHFARFLDVADVSTRDCMMAQLRFLTVRRYVTVAGGVGTYQAFRYPQVPAWNERLFPVRPPTGYTNWIDPLLLGSEWDVVITCGPCGGSGQVRQTYQESQTEYYTDSEGRSQSRTVYVTKERWVTCPTCGGSGRLLCQQVLNTQWQWLRATVTEPEMMLAELVEDAEEVTFVHLPIKEDRQMLRVPAKVAVPSSPAAKQLEQAARELAALHAEHANAVEELHDGVVYRADFRVCGFRTVRMEFRNLAGRVGWFFGKRPEFHFPRLPLSWGAVATGVFLPPLAVGLGLGVLAVAALVLGSPAGR